jgi:hypothetical protein
VDLADALTAMKTPSGKLYTWSLAPANRPQVAFGAGFGYAQATSFTPGGDPGGMSYGSGMTETVGRNARGQITSIVAQIGAANVLLNLTNEYEAAANNGNLKSQTMLPLGMKQSFSYDGKNRLDSAVETPVGGGAVSWTQTFGYDDFGNRWVTAITGALPGGGPRPNGPAWYQTGAGISNRVTGLAYDAAGNQLSMGGLTGIFDAENRLKGVTSGAFTYDYDAFGRRVRTVVGGQTIYFVYDAMGRLTAEYDGVVGAGTQKLYVVQDQLGSTRLVTNGSGAVIRRSDYLPYGEEIPGAVGGRWLSGYGLDGGVKQGFTSQMRDVETGLVQREVERARSLLASI